MDKREVMQVNGRFPGMKLLEIAETKDDSVAILNMIAGDWKGDHVYLVGDYARPKYAAHLYHHALQDWEDRFHIKKGWLSASLYQRPV